MEKNDFVLKMFSFLCKNVFVLRMFSFLIKEKVLKTEKKVPMEITNFHRPTKMHFGSRGMRTPPYGIYKRIVYVSGQVQPGIGKMNFVNNHESPPFCGSSPIFMNINEKGNFLHFGYLCSKLKD